MRQGNAVVCPEGEFGSEDGGRTHFPRFFRAIGASGGGEINGQILFGRLKTRRRRYVTREFPLPARKQNPLKTRPPAAV